MLMLQKKVFLMTHLYISPILNAAELMNNLEIQGCIDDSLWHYSHKQKAPFPQGVTTVDHQNPALTTPRMWPKYRKWKLVTHLVMSPAYLHKSKAPKICWCWWFIHQVDESHRNKRFTSKLPGDITVAKWVISFHFLYFGHILGVV